MNAKDITGKILKHLASFDCNFESQGNCRLLLMKHEYKSIPVRNDVLILITLLLLLKQSS